MEIELKCPLCNLWYRKALLLPCGHSLCQQCAINIIKEVGNSTSTESFLLNISSQNPQQLAIPNTNEQDSDHLSESSEADSGVVVSSRPISTNLLHTGSSTPIGTSSTSQGGSNTYIFVNNRPCVFSLNCPACKRLILLDASGVDCLVQNKALDRVVEKFKDQKLAKTNTESTKEIIYCQVCSDQPNSGIAAEWLCEQCELLYCNECLSRCHPSRGALSRHVLHSPISGRRLLDNRRRQHKALCPCHSGNNNNSNTTNNNNNINSNSSSISSSGNAQDMEMSLFCGHCRMIICSECVQQFHLKHEIHSIDTICKQQKTELSRLLQSLSEKAKSGMHFVHGLKSMSEKINKKCAKKEQEIISSIDEVIKELNEKKQELILQLREEKTEKTNQFKEFIHQSTNALCRANGCIQFCIEMLQETDAASFLLISNSLLTKVTTIEQAFVQEIEPKINQSGDFQLRISDMDKLQQIVSGLRLSEAPIEYYSASLSSEYETTDAPKAPIFWPEQCICTNNVFTVFWQPYPGPIVQHYTLEIDDGSGGPFRKVYRGNDCVCTVEGLHFNSVYSVRVRAHNQHGDSSYSDVICMQTGKLTMFTMMHKLNSEDIHISNSGMTISTDSNEERICLGSTGLSRGIHYWEWRIDRMDSTESQPAFGIARSDCNKDEMLGTDDKGWSMYINSRRSWFLHKHEHFERTDGGIKLGTIVGVRFDCDKGNLSFYIDDEPHGPIGFSRLNASTMTTSNKVYNTLTNTSQSTNWNTLSSSNSTSNSNTSSGGNSNANRATNFYPAVSINKSIQLTLIVGREPPSESSGESSEDDDTASTAILMPL